MLIAANEDGVENAEGASVVLKQKVRRGDDVLVAADGRVAFVSAGRARPIPKPLRVAMKADLDEAGTG